jgi:hypothetical protein
VDRRRHDATTFLRCVECGQLWLARWVNAEGVCYYCYRKHRDDRTQSLLEALKAELEHTPQED